MILDYKRILWSLVVGFLVGAALTRWADVGGRHLSPVERERHMFEHVSAKLELTPGQQQSLQAILDEKRQKIDALRGEFRPRFEAIHQSMRTDIRRMLDAKQQARFDEMQKEWEARRKKHEREFGAPPMP
ncbi:MAG: periplasmic heavy metal sensor [Elusimicrobia bacterium]|nr:periplasmic heavy metal sensor [Elusimicrobiota bacterium]